MDITRDYKDRSEAILAMFEASFRQSEGQEAGAEIRGLVSDMLAELTSEDRHVFTALSGEDVLASIVFSRMTFPEDERTVFILSPVAVAPGHQGKGIGQKLIRSGLQALQDEGVDVALTYGDINFYSKVGFAQITQAEVQPPLPLSYPHGWLGQSLREPQLVPLQGPSQCMAPLNHPNYW